MGVAARSERGLPWSHLFLAGLVLLSVVGSIQAARWVDGLTLLPWAALAGLLSGTLLARSPWPGRFAHPAALLLAGPILTLLLASDLDPGLVWRARLAELGARFSRWLAVVGGGGESRDPFIFLALLVLLGWWLGYAVSWAVLRQGSAWWAVVLAALPLTINRYYGPPALDPYLVLFILFSLLLVIRLELHRRQRGWQRARLKFDPSQGWDYLRDGALFSVLALFLAWSVPLSSSPVSADLGFLGTLQRGWGMIQGEFDRLFHVLRGYRSEGYVALYGQRHDLRGAIHLEEDLIMTVHAEEGRYWRGMLYQVYDGRGWSNSDEGLSLIEAGDPLPREGEYSMRQTLAQSVTLAVPSGGQLFAASQPLIFDRAVEARLSYLDPPSNSAAAVAAVNSRPSLGPGETYGVVSWLTVADVESLRAAGSNYPDWVLRQYLQLPEDLPPRVAALARGITANYDNPYDRATALESYLRGIVYNEHIPDPPTDRDLVGWFLFDLRQGYCDYYASAMAVMARAVGIPARVAVGFARGEYDRAAGIFTVRAWDAHTWVEVYFPPYGWVEFEPTAGEPPIERPQPPASQDLGERPPRQDLPERRFREREIPEDEGVLVPESETTGNGLGLLLGFFLVLPVAAGFGWWLSLEREVGDLPPAERAYRSVVFYARELGIDPRPHQTPLEYAAAVEAVLPEAGPEAIRIADLFAAERFRLGGLMPPDEEALAQAWSQLRWRLWRGVLRRALALVRAPFLRVWEPLYRDARRLLG